MNHEDLDYPEYHYQGMGCGLEDRGITDRYEAMQYGWDEAIERCATEVVEPLLDKINELEASNKVNAEDCNEAERILHNIIKEWSSSNDVFGAIQQAREFLK